MKKIIVFTQFLLLLSFISVFAQSTKVITFNLRYDNNADGENAWNVRKTKVVEMLNFYEPDILGIQEGLISQINYLDSNLIQYQHVGIGRDDGKTKGEYSAIYFKKEKIKMLKTATFWLSETPDTVSRGWDAVCNRICTYALFINKKTSQKFWVFNTHFDHIGEKAQKNSAELIIKKIMELNIDNLPVILTGDFNMTADKTPIKYISGILKDSKHDFSGTSDESEGTYNAFDFCKPVYQRIDYIFLNKFKVLKYRVLTDSFHCRYLSDHLPVFVEITL